MMKTEDTGKGCGKEIGKHMLVALLLLAVLFGPCGIAAIESLRADAAPLVGPPVGAIQLFENTSFEEGAEPWTLEGAVGLTMATAYDGDYALQLGGVDAWGMAMRTFDLSRCDGTSPVWIRASYSIVVVPPLTDPGYDVSEGWITDETGAWMISLWSRYDYEYDGDAAWYDHWIMVEGLQDAISTGRLYIGGVTNEQPSYFFHDTVEMWCVPVMYRLFLPIVQK